ncbi:MAG: AzlC family ABC transporter permease [Candidatus Limivicinus sp.]
MNKIVFKKALTACLPVISSFIVIGISFGVVVQSRGFGLLWAGAMSVFIYAGSMQFVALELMGSGAGLLTAAVTTVMVNLRHVFYGLSMIDKYKDMGKARPYLIFALCDETYSLVCNPPALAPGEEKAFYLLVSAMNQVSWVLGSILGGLLGAALPFSTEGIDFALTALFVSVVAEQWLSTREHTPALLGLGLSLLCLLLFGAENFLLPAMILILLSLSLYRRGKGARA